MDYPEDLWNVTSFPNEGQLLPEPTFMEVFSREMCRNIVLAIMFVSHLFWYFSLGNIVTPLRGPWCVCEILFMSTFGAGGVLLIFRVVRKSSHTEDPTPQMIMAVSFVLIFESMYRLCRSFNRWRAALQVRSDETRNDGDIVGCSWPCIWYLLLLGSYCINRAQDISDLNYYKYEYVGPMRLTKVPKLYYGNETYDYGNLLELFPCLEAHADPCPGGVIEQPSVVVTLEIGWGTTWGCRSTKNSDRWNTNWPRWNPCTTFVCREDGFSTCDCHAEKASAWNASEQCIQNAFNLSLLEQNATFDRHQSPWEDERNWPTLPRYGNCDGNVGFSATTERVEKTMEISSLYQMFGLVLLLFGSSMILLKTTKCAQEEHNKNASIEKATAEK